MPVSPRCPAAGVGRQAQPWESLGTWKLPKAHDDCTAPETWPATRDGQSQHASTLPVWAPPHALFLGDGWWSPQNQQDHESSLLLSWFLLLKPRGVFAPTQTRGQATWGWNLLGVRTGPEHCPAGPAAGQRLCKGVGWQEGPCSTSPGSESLWLFPHLARAQGWPGHGWYGDNPTLAKAAPKPCS